MDTCRITKNNFISSSTSSSSSHDLDEINKYYLMEDNETRATNTNCDKQYSFQPNKEDNNIPLLRETNSDDDSSYSKHNLFESSSITNTSSSTFKRRLSFRTAKSGFIENSIRNFYNLSHGSSRSKRGNNILGTVDEQGQCLSYNHIHQHPEQILLDAIDRIEDEIEDHAFYNLLPNNVRLLVEENVYFGNYSINNFMMDVFIHVFYSVFAFIMLFYSFTLFVMNDKSAICKLLTWLYVDDGASITFVQRYRAIFEMIRFAVSFIAFISAFRTVRRRRHVWLRSSYGSSEYNNDIVYRTNSLKEADRFTLLGKLRQQVVKNRDSILANRVERKLNRAKDRFESSKTYTSPHSAKSVLNDHSKMIEPIQTIPYSHGGFFGAAPFMLGDPLWIDILRTLMPDVYCAVALRINSPTHKLIHWAENNPVVAAYGTLYQLKNSKTLSTIEWDIFLDPMLVKKLADSLTVRDHVQNKVNLLGQKRHSFTQGCENNTKIKSSQATLLNDCEILLQAHDDEVNRNAINLLERMLIAHGNTTQLVLEQTGYMKQYVFSRVKRSCKTLGGGMSTKQWLAVYAEALRLGCNESNIFSFTSSESSHTNTSLDALAISKCPTHSILESLNIVQTILGKPLSLFLDLKSRHVPKRIWAFVVDSLYDAGAVVDAIGTFYPHEIRGVSSQCLNTVKEIVFLHGAGDMQKSCAEGKIKKGDIVFFNAGSLIKNKSHKIKKVDVTENIYDLQPFATWDSNSTTITESTMQVNELKQCHSHSTVLEYKKKYKLKIGLYCQEFAIDKMAVNLLVKHVNENSTIYDQGFSWGGLNGLTINGVHSRLFAATDGMWTQRLVASSWNLKLHPPNKKRYGSLIKRKVMTDTTVTT